METRQRLIRRVPSAAQMDTVRARQEEIGRAKDSALLDLFRDLWLNMEDFRQQRARAFRFAYDDQWGDLMEVNGEVMTQRQYLQKTGNIVLQTNQVQNKVETMAGVIEKESLEFNCKAIDLNEQQFGELVTEGVRANADRNSLSELYLDWAKELCLGGLMVGYESWDQTSGPDGTLDSWTTYVNPNMFIFDCTMDDSRFWDASKFGRQIKLDFGKLCARFAHSPRDYAMLRDIYPTQSDMFAQKGYIHPSERVKESIYTFMEDTDPSVCMVLEAWTKETRPRIRLHDTNNGTETIIDYDDAAYRRDVRMENKRRRQEGLGYGWKESEISYIEGDGKGDDGFFIDEFWYCRFLAPDGTVLWEGESPLPGRGQPFTVRAIPLMEGKIQGYLYPEIDHNLIMNRAVVLNDWLQRENAKGVVVVPKGILGGMSPKEFATAWTSIDEMVFIDVKPGMENLMPKVYYGNAQNFDVARYLDTFNRMGDKSTAMTDAIQGKTPLAGTSGNLYAQMANNSTTAIAAYLKKFHTFIKELGVKKLQNLVFFYDEERWRNIMSTVDSILGGQDMNLNEIRLVQYDLRVDLSSDTPLMREVAEADAKEFLAGGFIDFTEYADASRKPWVQRIMQKRQARQAEMESAGAMPSDSNTPAGVMEQQAQGQQAAIPQQQIPQAQ